MNILDQYRNYFFSGEWHIHTSFTDGQNSILDYAQAANELRVPLLAFTEHVRKKLDYNYDEFLNEIKIAKKKYPDIIILSGIEAKVLPNGELDCQMSVLQKADYRLFAFHSFPKDLETYFSSIKNIIENYNVDTWAHPGLFFRKYKDFNLNDVQLEQIFELTEKHNIFLEFNIRYKLPKIDWINKFLKISNKANLILGTDAHSIDDLYKIRKIKQAFIDQSGKLFSKNVELSAFVNWFIENYSEEVNKNKKPKESKEN